MSPIYSIHHDSNASQGKTLEETSALFDGKEVVQNIANVGNEAAHQSRHHYRQFEKPDDVELTLSKHESRRSAAFTSDSIDDGRPESRDSIIKQVDTIVQTPTSSKGW